MSEASSFRRETDRLFTGELAHAAGKLVVDDDERSYVPAARLLRPRALEEAVERFGARYPGGDRRAVASLWSQWYLGALVVPSIAAGLLLERVLPLGIDDIDVALDDEGGHAVAFRLPHGGRRDPGADVFERFEPLLRGHLEPFVGTLVDRYRVSPGLLWCNAGRYLQWILDEIEGREGDAPPPDTGRRLLTARSRPDGSPNPLHGTVRRVESEDERVPRRRVCCLRFMLPGVRGCGNLCPLPEVRASEPNST